MYCKFFLIIILINIEIINAQGDTLIVKNTLMKGIDLNETIITATRTPKKINSLSLPAQVVTKSEINAINSIRLNDIISEQTGLTSVSDYGGVEGIQLQGMDSQYVLILVDDVPLIGRSAGTFDLRRLSLGNVERIEIVKGASSSLYGNEALGGVVNILTSNIEPGLNGNLSYRKGSFNNNDLSTNLNYKKGQISSRFFVNRFSSDGYDLNDDTPLKTVDPYNNYTLQSKIIYEYSNNTSISLSGRYYKQLQDNVAPENLIGQSTTRDWNGLLKVNHEFSGDISSCFEFYFTKFSADEFLRTIDGDLFNKRDFTQTFLRPEFRTVFGLNSSTIVAGAGITKEKLERTDFFGIPKFDSPYFYLQYDINITDNTNLILGGRYDNHSEYESQLSPKASIKYSPTEDIVLRSSIGYGYKAPDFRQLYFNFTNATIGYTVLGYHAVKSRISELQANEQIIDIIIEESELDSKLKAENSVSFNFGVNYNPKEELNFNINIFRNDIANLIDTRAIARKINGQNVFSYYNINKVFTQGLEFNGSWRLKDNISFSLGYQLLFAKDKQAISDFKNNKVFARLSQSSPAFRLNAKDYFGLANRSRHMGNLKVFYYNKNNTLGANIRGVYRGKYGLFDTNSNVYLDKYDNFVSNYMIWDLAINKKLFKRHKLGFGIDNIFNFKNPQNISNIAGRIVYLTFNIKN